MTYDAQAVRGIGCLVAILDMGLTMYMISNLMRCWNTVQSVHYDGVISLDLFWDVAKLSLHFDTGYINWNIVRSSLRRCPWIGSAGTSRA